MRTASRNFFLFSGQTAKPSAWAQNRSNRLLPSRCGDQLFGLIRPFHSRKETIGAGAERVKLGFQGLVNQFGKVGQKPSRRGFKRKKTKIKLVQQRLDLSYLFVKVHIFRIKSQIFGVRSPRNQPWRY